MGKAVLKVPDLSSNLIVFSHIHMVQCPHHSPQAGIRVEIQVDKLVDLLNILVDDVVVDVIVKSYHVLP
jgi:hypothetical protein